LATQFLPFSNLKFVFNVYPNPLVLHLSLPFLNIKFQLIFKEISIDPLGNLKIEMIIYDSYYHQPLSLFYKIISPIVKEISVRELILGKISQLKGVVRYVDK
jgi:hypothetical protein